MRDHLPPGLPPDPFADDPNDPSAVLDELEPGQPLDPQERLAVEADLADLAIYEALQCAPAVMTRARSPCWA